MGYAHPRITPRMTAMTSQQRTTLVVAVSVVGGAFLLVVAVVVGAVVLSRNPSPDRVWEREEFRRAVMGKTPDGVIAAVGRPGSAQDHPDGQPDYWIYWGRVRNPTTGRAGDAWVEFERGVVVNVRW
jgi:hypothetical protein